MGQAVSSPGVINKRLQDGFSLKVPTKKFDVCFERNVGISQQFFRSAQAKTFGVLIFYNCHKLKPPKLQRNSEKSLAFISPRFFFFSEKVNAFHIAFLSKM